MKLDAPHTGRNRSRSLLLVSLAALSFFTLLLPASYAGPVPSGKVPQAVKSAPAPERHAPVYVCLSRLRPEDHDQDPSRRGKRLPGLRLRQDESRLLSRHEKVAAEKTAV